MITDTEIMRNGIKTLIEKLGLVEAERFLVLLQREPFDYTQWRKSLWEGASVEEISRKAMEFRKLKKLRTSSFLIGFHRCPPPPSSSSSTNQQR